MGRMFCFHPLILLICVVTAPSLAFLSAAPRNRNKGTRLTAAPQPSVIIVGKIIVDEYGNPDSPVSPNVTVGGGGPQAAMGAALALATRSYNEGRNSQSPPPPQPVTLVGAVGEDFSSQEEQALSDILSPALQEAPKFLRGTGLVTPRIRLWHDEQQVLQWYALDDSFGESGAGQLWKKLPSVNDFLDVLRQDSNNKPILHVISEGGVEAPGGNGDSQPLLDSSVRNAISFLGVEPILFPNDEGMVSEEDSNHCSKLLQGILDAAPQDPASVVFSPDMAAFRGLSAYRPKSPALDSWAVRDGPQGSHIHQQSTAAHIPAASLQQLVNPTGAGNAYAAAYTTLRGSGCDPMESACIATGVGAVFCEYEHFPPYTWDVVERVAQASQQVRAQVKTKKEAVKQ